MKKVFAFSLIILGFTSLYAQGTIDTNKVFTIVQQKPEFPAGDFNKWLADNIVYPQDAIAKNLEGTVYVSFIVERNGTVTNAKVLRGVDKSLDNEAIRVISMMPKWQPGMQNGHTVRVAYTVPIRFKLSGGDLANSSNTTKLDTTGGKIYTTEDQKPEFNGDLNKFLSTHLTYPPRARNSDIQGTVYISFVVEADGSITNIKVLRSVEASLDNEAKRVVSLMPKWIPGKQNGVPVRTLYNLPINFIMRDETPEVPQSSNPPNSMPSKNNNDSYTSNSSTSQPVQDPNGKTIQVDQKPEFHGNLLNYLATNIHYPEKSKENKIEGTVYTSFVVGTDGVVSGAKIERAGAGREELEKESLRVLYGMPPWKPALIDGQPVAVRLFIEIPFFINADEN